MKYMNSETWSALLTYAEASSEVEPPLLSRLRRETHVKVLYPRMLVSASQGRLLALFSKLIRPKRILEVGTFTGYSCICLAEGLQEEGQLISIDINPERDFLIEPFLKEAGIREKVELKYGPAKTIIPTLSGSFDLIFIDADKGNYPDYADMLIPFLRKGGLMIADNVLWHGNVLDQSSKDKETQGIIQFNQKVLEDDRVETLLLPFGDGFSLLFKK